MSATNRSFDTEKNKSTFPIWKGAFLRPNLEKKRRHLHVFLQYAAVSRQNRIVRSVLQRRALLWFKKTTLGNRMIFYAAVPAESLEFSLGFPASCPGAMPFGAPPGPPPNWLPEPPFAVTEVPPVNVPPSA